MPVNALADWLALTLPKSNVARSVSLRGLLRTYTVSSYFNDSLSNFRRKLREVNAECKAVVEQFHDIDLTFGMFNLMWIRGRLVEASSNIPLSQS